MLLFKTYLTRSAIHGIGVFAARRIHKGDAVWAYHEVIDRRIHTSELGNFPPFLRDRIRQLSYVNPKNPEHLVLCGDDARFMNFALEGTTPNCGLDRELNGELTLIATRDIDIGEELTVGVESDSDAERKLSEAAMTVPGIF